MRSRLLTFTAEATLFAAVAIPPSLAAQEVQQGRPLPLYTIADLGTLGGTFRVEELAMPPGKPL